jgi:hypothetical protein
VAGDNLSVGTGIKGFSTAPVLGSLTPSAFLGGSISLWADQYVASAYVVTGFSVTTAVDPGKLSIQKIVANGVTWTIGAGTTYLYSGGVAQWSESINAGNGFAFVGGNTYNPSKVNQ